MPSIQRFPNNASLDEVLKALYTDGVVQIKSLINRASVDRIKAEVAISAQGNTSDVFNTETQVICSIAGIPYLGWHELDRSLNLFRTNGESWKGLTGSNAYV